MTILNDNDINDPNNSFCIKYILMCQAVCWALERVDECTHTHFI